MSNLQNLSFEQLKHIYSKNFSLGYLNTDCNEKFALISMICTVTYELRKKGKEISCYDVLLKIGKSFSELEKNTFFKSLGCVCEDFLYGCDTFPDFGLKPAEMPKMILKILEKHVPF